MKITRYVAFEPLLLFSRKGLAIWKTSFWWSGMSACYCWFCQSPIFTREAIDGSLRVAGICFCVVTLINCFTVDDEKERQDKSEQKLEAERKYNALMGQKSYMKKFLQKAKDGSAERLTASESDSGKLSKTRPDIPSTTANAVSRSGPAGVVLNRKDHAHPLDR